MNFNKLNYGILLQISFEISVKIPPINQMQSKIFQTNQTKVELITF